MSVVSKALAVPSNCIVAPVSTTNAAELLRTILFAPEVFPLANTSARVSEAPAIVSTYFFVAAPRSTDGSAFKSKFPVIVPPARFNLAANNVFTWVWV